MSLQFLKDFLLISLAINYSILLIWFFAFAFARNFIVGLHHRWFKLTSEQFDAVHYCCMGAYKIGIILFNLVPLVALWLMGSGS